MNQYTSDKIKILSFISIILVLYIHTGFPKGVIESMNHPVQLRNFVCSHFTSFAVPLFCSISGFLFFRNIESFKDVMTKIQKRFYSLFIPFLCASIVFIFTIFILQTLPQTRSFIHAESLSDSFSKMSFLEIICSVFIDRTGNIIPPWETPIAFHLWFLRDLIIIVTLLSPILYFLNKKSHPLITLILCFIAAFLFPSFSLTSSALWFVFGFCVFKNKWIDNKILIFFTIVLIGTIFTPPYLHIYAFNKQCR